MNQSLAIPYVLCWLIDCLLLKILPTRILCVCEIQALLRIAQPTVSKHLKILEDAGLATFRKDGLWVNYQLDNGSRSPYAATILENLRHWLNDDEAIRTLLERTPNVSREEIRPRRGFPPARQDCAVCGRAATAWKAPVMVHDRSGQ